LAKPTHFWSSKQHADITFAIQHQATTPANSESSKLPALLAESAGYRPILPYRRFLYQPDRHCSLPSIYEAPSKQRMPTD